MNLVVAKDNVEDGAFTDELQAGTTLLQGQFVIQSFLNSGGFGMTYLAKDSLDRTVVIKECFPATVCTRSDNTVRARSRSHQKDFKSIVKLFLQEARQLAKLKHQNIVGVHQVFEDNETAYMALDFVDGLDLLDIIEDGNHNISAEKLNEIVLNILSAVGYMHEQNILHRDISPDNIILDQSGNPVLIDFGAAREKASKASRALSALMVVKDGYSPQEFYISGSEQGPSSDLYALAASLYHLIVGQAPPNSQTRLAAIAEKKPDPYQSAGTRVTGYDPVFLAAIDKGLNIFPKDRFQSAREWVVAIDQEQRVEQARDVVEQQGDFDQSISRLVSETNHAVREAQKQSVEKKVVEETIAPVSKLRQKFAEIARELAMDDEPEEEYFEDIEVIENFDDVEDIEGWEPGSEDREESEVTLPTDEHLALQDEITDDPALKDPNDEGNPEETEVTQLPPENEQEADPKKGWLINSNQSPSLLGRIFGFKKHRTDNVGKAGL